jgi:hypothetical protein
MGFLQKGKQHHCPGQFGKVDGVPGNCRQHEKYNYCTTHQMVCPVHKDWHHMKNDICAKCEQVEAAKLR